jgi:peptidoglycan hydrolase-like protein with peptidoglycan-binding domain
VLFAAWLFGRLTLRPVDEYVSPPPLSSSPQPAVQTPRETPVQSSAIRALTANEVMELQRFLKAKGYYTLKVDGIAGPGTRSATLKYLHESNHPAEFADDSRILVVIRAN